MTIKQVIKDIKNDIKVEERNAKASDKVWGCCDKSLSDGVLCGLESGLHYLQSIEPDKEDIAMLERENKAMAKALKKLKFTPKQVSDIANGAI